jgi:hypothetical protein
MKEYYITENRKFIKIKQKFKERGKTSISFNLN